MSKRSFGAGASVNSSGSSICATPRISKKFKNSLDSDEEDDEEAAEKQNALDPEDFEGQEESTLDHDGEIKITPFNMKDELEEGHFDKDGTFIFDRNKDEIRDQWLDDIDWVKVKYGAAQPEKEMHSSDSEDAPELDTIGHYKKMLELMKPNETVQTAIRRLGGSKKSSRRGKKSEEEPDAVKEQLEKMQLLTGYASDIIQSGDMDIYQQTYERLSYLVENSEKSSNIYSSNEASDMFGEKFEESDPKQQNTHGHKSAEESEVRWEFKWENKEESPVYGPHSTHEMLQWVQDGYFHEGVYVRKVGSFDSPFYSSKRMDFELYL